MSSAVFLSIILPTYNRKYIIEKMIDSVLGQDFGNFELIVVDDGSTDGSARMLEERYSDNRLRIIEKKNNGVSSARNVGISMARGEWIMFVDSDDYLLDGFFGDIYKTLNKYDADVLVYGGYSIDGVGGGLRNVPLFWRDYSYGGGEIVVRNGWEFLEDFCLLSGNSWGCAKVFKRSLIEKNQIRFDEGICYGEDMLFNIQSYFVASKVIASPKKFYVNNIGGESLSRGGISSVDKLKNLAKVYEKTKSYERFCHLLALNCIRHMRKWILFGAFRLDGDTKIKIQKIYQDLPSSLCASNEKLEKIVSRHSLGCAILAYFSYFTLQRIYSKLSFLHPLTTPWICKIKKNI